MAMDACHDDGFLLGCNIHQAIGKAPYARTAYFPKNDLMFVGITQDGRYCNFHGTKEFKPESRTASFVPARCVNDFGFGFRLDYQ